MIQDWGNAVSIGETQMYPILAGNHAEGRKFFLDAIGKLLVSGWLMKLGSGSGEGGGGTGHSMRGRGREGRRDGGRPGPYGM